MAIDPKEIQKMLLGLAPEKQKEVFDFIQFLEKKEKRGKKKIEFNWVGGLEHLKDKYTSVELQHKINEWRM